MLTLLYWLYQLQLHIKTIILTESTCTVHSCSDVSQDSLLHCLTSTAENPSSSTGLTVVSSRSIVPTLSEVCFISIAGDITQDNRMLARPKVRELCCSWFCIIICGEHVTTQDWNLMSDLNLRVLCMCKIVLNFVLSFFLSSYSSLFCQTGFDINTK